MVKPIAVLGVSLVSLVITVSVTTVVANAVRSPICASSGSLSSRLVHAGVNSG
jgi:hypothetical protein